MFCPTQPLCLFHRRMTALEADDAPFASCRALYVMLQSSVCYAAELCMFCCRALYVLPQSSVCFAAELCIFYRKALYVMPQISVFNAAKLCILCRKALYVMPQISVFNAAKLCMLCCRALYVMLPVFVSTTGAHRTAIVPRTDTLDSSRCLGDRSVPVWIHATSGSQCSIFTGRSLFPRCLLPRVRTASRLQLSVDLLDVVGVSVGCLLSLF